MKHKRIQEKRNKWIAMLLLLCLFYGDAQAYVPYIRYAMQKERIVRDVSADAASNKCCSHHSADGCSLGECRKNHSGVLATDGVTPHTRMLSSASAAWGVPLSEGAAPWLSSAAQATFSAADASHSHIPTSVQVGTTKDVGEIPYQSGTTPTGGVTYSVPIEVAPGRGNLKPELSITYNSQSGNDALSYGWSIGGLSAISKVSKNLYYNSTVTPVSLSTGDALMLDGMRLLPTGVANQFEPERGNMRITGNVYDGDYRSFTVEYPNGMVGTYGFPSGTAKQLAFPITRLTDALGNYMDFTYEQVDNRYYVTKISYGAHTSSATHLAEVVFTYASRSDVAFIYEAGRKVEFSRLLDRIECKNGSELLHTYTFTYERDSWNDPSLLTTLGCDNLNPLRFYYGYADNTDSRLQYDDHILYPYFGSDVSIVASKFKLQGGEEDDGLIVYPSKNPFVQYGTDRYESGFATNQRLMVYGHVTDFSTPLPMEFTAGTGFQCLMAGDVDGKSGDELLKINNTVVNGKDRLTVAVYKYNIVSPFGLANTFTFDSTPAKSNSFWPKRYLLGDFNGDGTVELIAISINGPLAQWSLGSRVFLFNPFTNTTYYNAASPFPLDASDQLVPMDVDGDGKTEICHFDYNGLSVYGFQVSSAGVYTFTKLFTEPTLAASYLFDRIHAFGDINGDGKCDMVVSPKRSREEFTTETMPVYTQTECTNCPLAYVVGICPLCGTDVEPAIVCVECETLLDKNGKCPYHGSEVTKSVTRYYDYGNYWDVYYNTGTGFYKTSQYNSKYDTHGIRCLLQDVNQDGCADLIRVHGKNLSVYYSRDGRLGSSSVSLNIPSLSDEVTLVPSNVALPDYYNFLLAIHGETLLKLYSTKNEMKQRFLTGMANSLGAVQHNYFQRLNDGSIEEGSGVFYENGYVAPSSHPYESYCGPLWAVSRQDIYMTNEQQASIAYNYKGAVIHRQGLGFRGFTEIDTQDLFRSRTSKAIYNPLQYGIPVSMDSDEAEETYTYNVSVASNKKLTANMTNKVAENKLTHATATSNYLYDSYGNCVSETTDYADGTSTSVLQNKKVRLYANQKTAGHYLIGLPVSNTNIITRGSDVWREDEEISYKDNTTLPVRNVAYVQSPDEMVYQTGETRYTYDTYGNVQTKKQATYNSANFLGDTYTYDANGRYPSTVTDALGRTTTYNTYNKWGKPSSATNYLGKQTTYAYDALGRNTTTIAPDGTTQSVSYIWNPAKGLYGTIKSATGAPDEMACYDALKREVRTGNQRFNGEWQYIDKEYDTYGRLQRASMPFTGSAATRWNTYGYDSHDRIVRLSEASGKVTAYSYSGNSVTTTEKGISTIRTKDASGQMIKVSDPSGEAVYAYRADGQLKGITAPGGVVTSFEYDVYGRKTKMVDPSAGTQTSSETNHADGSYTMSQTDAKGLTTTVNYDAYGRVVSVTRPEFNTSYTYDDTTKELLSEISTNGTKKEYTYDAYGRLGIEKETVDNVWL